MVRNYKIEDVPWELIESRDSKSFVYLYYERRHEDYQYKQWKQEVYRKTPNGLKLICFLESGVLGGTWTATYDSNWRKFDDLQLYAGNHAKRTGVRTGTKGEVTELSIDEDEDKILIKNKYKTGRWSRNRTWTIEITEDE